jgi:chromatin remodeling complex protein RSC6
MIPKVDFYKPMTPSQDLGFITGWEPINRPEAVKRIWIHIKKNNLQDSNNRRIIHCDKIMNVITGEKSISMFELTKHLNKHLT